MRSQLVRINSSLHSGQAGYCTQSLHNAPEIIWSVVLSITKTWLTDKQLDSLFIQRS